MKYEDTVWGTFKIKNENMDNPLCLSNKVYDALENDPELYLVWCINQGRYDEERDPLHNKEYVAGCMREEERRLEELRIKIAKIKKDFAEKKF